MTLSTALRPLFLSAMPFGVVPFAIQGQGQTPNVVTNRACSLYALLALTILTSLYIYVFTTEPVSDIYAVYDDENQKNYFLEEATDSLEAYSSAFASCVCVLCTFTNRRKITTIINQLQWFDAAIIKRNKHTKKITNKLNNSHNIPRTLIIFFGSWFWVLSTGILERINYPDETKLQWAMYVLPVGVTTQLTLQYVVIATAARWRFRRLSAFAANGRSEPIECEYIMSAHAYLNVIVSLLKETYRDQILAVIMQSSVTIISCAFSVANAVLNMTDDNTVWIYAYTLVMFAFCILQMTAVVWASVQLSLEVKRTVRITFGADLNYNVDNTSRMLFAFQALHDDSEFELCRGFPVDGSLLSNLVGTVTTYLLIVIQFKINLMD